MQNGVPDLSTLTMPEPQVDEDLLKREKEMARFADSSEYQKLKEHLISRKEFYKTYLPDGRALTEKDSLEHLGQNWLVANAVVAEIDLILNNYELAKQNVTRSR